MNSIELEVSNSSTFDTYTNQWLMMSMKIVCKTKIVQIIAEIRITKI